MRILQFDGIRRQECFARKSCTLVIALSHKGYWFSKTWRINPMRDQSWSRRFLNTTCPLFEADEVNFLSMNFCRNWNKSFGHDNKSLHTNSCGLPDWLTDWLTQGPTDFWLTVTVTVTEWLTSVLTNWLTDWLTDQRTDWLTYWLIMTDLLTDWLTDSLTHLITGLLTSTVTMAINTLEDGLVTECSITKRMFVYIFK